MPSTRFPIHSVAPSEREVGPTGCIGSAKTDRLRWRRDQRATAVGVALLALLALLALTLTACSSNSSSPTTTVSSKPVIQQSGTGSKTLGSVTLSAKWTVTWKFNCTNPVTASRFVLTATKSSGSPISITDQTGLGGGGTKAYTKTGTFAFAVATSCSWNVLVGPTALTTSTTTTTSPSTTAST